MSDPNHLLPPVDDSIPDEPVCAAAEATPCDETVNPKDFLLSFYCSQGDPELQYDLFRWVHLNCPNLRMTSEQQQTLFQVCQPATRTIALTGNQHVHGEYMTEQTVDSELRLELKRLRRVLNSGQLPLSPDNLLDRITQRVIDLDYGFTVADGPRVRPPQVAGAPYNFHTDPMLSHLCYHALEGHPTGSARWDELFTIVGDYVRNLPPDDKRQPMIAAIIETHASSHPTAAPPSPEKHP